MELPNYSELRERYSKLSTEELINRAATSDLTEQAQLAMDAELDRRKIILDSTPVEMRVVESDEMPKWVEKLIFTLIMVFLGIIFPLLLPYWRSFVTWVSE